MSFTFTTTIKSFLLPGDGAEAKALFLSQLNNQGEVFLIAYGFTLDSMINELLAAHTAGIPVHIYLDHTQSAGATEKPEVKRLADAGMDVTIGTSTEGSAYICHTKGIVVLDEPDTPFCWEGSCNFSESGWHQVNTISTFRSRTWADHFLTQFSLLKSFAWAHERSFQLAAEPVMAITPSPVCVTTGVSVGVGAVGSGQSGAISPG